ncbi:hypothetical protein BDR07DRAFT_1378777 [Suillus spraguei]|nr:hypothetical protein BDR07DRAFT_1378777 [Suillus spraguei]
MTLPSIPPEPEIPQFETVVVVVNLDTYTGTSTENNGKTKVKEVKSMKVKEFVFHVSAPNYLEFLATMLAENDKSLYKVKGKELLRIVWAPLVEVTRWIHEGYTIPEEKIFGAYRLNETYGDWEEIVHPAGITYYFARKTKTYTAANIKEYSHLRLRDLNNWIDAARRTLQEDTWFLVVEPIARQDGDRYEYYCADIKQHVIAWFHAFDAHLLFQECAFAREWNHKRKFQSPANSLRGLELEAQFWKHVDFFPRHYEMRPSDAGELRAHLEWFLAEGLTLEQSTAASLFRNNEEAEKILSCIIRFESDPSSNNFMTEQGVAFCGHHQFLNYYGLPEARLMRSHSVEGTKRKRTLPLLLATAAMFGVPALVLEHIDNIYVDGIVNSLDISQFVDRFNEDNVKHSTLVRAYSYIDMGKPSKLTSCIIEAGVIMAVDASVTARHFGEKMKSLDFAHLNDNCTRVVVIYSAPALFRTTR